MMLRAPPMIQATATERPPAVVALQVDVSLRLVVRVCLSLSVLRLPRRVAREAAERPPLLRPLSHVRLPLKPLIALATRQRHPLRLRSVIPKPAHRPKRSATATVASVHAYRIPSTTSPPFPRSWHGAASRLARPSAAAARSVERRGCGRSSGRQGDTLAQSATRPKVPCCVALGQRSMERFQVTPQVAASRSAGIPPVGAISQRRGMASRHGKGRRLPPAPS